MALGHPHCHNVDGLPVNGIGAGNDMVLERYTTWKHTTDSAKHRVKEHYSDGPCPDPTGTYDLAMTNVTWEVPDKTDLLTTTTGEGRETSMLSLEDPKVL